MCPFNAIDTWKGDLPGVNVAGPFQEFPGLIFGQVVYDLRKDFDADPNELRQAFDFYFEAMPETRIEVK